MILIGHLDILWLL